MKTLLKSPMVLFFLLMLIGIAPISASPSAAVLDSPLVFAPSGIDLTYQYDLSPYLDADACVVDGVPVIFSYSQAWDITYQRKNGDIIILRMSSNLLSREVYPLYSIKLASGVCAQ